MNDSLIETVVARDVLQMQAVTKPALLRHLFALAAQFPAQVLSDNKMLGKLTDAGNTVTLAHYLRVLETACLASGLELYSKGLARKRGSSLKLLLWNNALVSAGSLGSCAQALADGPWVGSPRRECGGASLLLLHGPSWSVTYWRDGQAEVDFVVSHGARTWALEVKSGRGGKTSGLRAFRHRYPKAEVWLLGEAGVPLADFFARPAAEWFT